MVAIVGRLFYLQMYKHDYYVKVASSQHWIKDTIPAERGKIFAEDSLSGTPYILASNQSLDVYLKRLIVGGYEKVFTIARNFRNEGIDRWHNPEFTMMEIYQAYADYNDMMKLFEDIYEYSIKKINGSTKINFRGKLIDFKTPWKRMTMSQAIKKYAGIEIEKMDVNELEKFAKKNSIKYKEKTWGWIVQGIFEDMCEEKIEQPTFILDHPLETTPLCKAHRNDKLCRLIERFEPFCMGAELGNAYSELNDPMIQRKLLEEQQKMLKKTRHRRTPATPDPIRPARGRIRANCLQQLQRTSRDSGSTACASREGAVQPVRRKRCRSAQV